MADLRAAFNAKAPDSRGFSFVLHETPARLELHAAHHPKFGPVFADWQSVEMRRRGSAGKLQLLSRACGLNHAKDLRILDATGGLGTDAWTLAALGARVTLTERNGTVFRLLWDAHRRSTAVQPEIAQRLTLVDKDARELMSQPWDVIHLDPMFPQDSKTALPSKELQILRELCGDDTDAHELLEPARACAKRVAVKRLLAAPRLSDVKPDAVLKGTQVRYDLYFRK